MIWEERASKVTGLSVTNTEWWEQFLEQTAQSAAGVTVTPTGAMKQSVVFRCVALIASIGTLPLKYYKRQSDGGKQLADKDNLWKVLHDQPNSEQTAVEFWEMMFGHLALRYNAYAQIIRDQAERISLWPLNPAKMEVKRVSGKLVYIYDQEGGKPIKFKAEEIFHVRGMMNNGLVGVSPIANAVDTIGLRMAQEKYASKLFANGVLHRGIWKWPGRFKTKEAKKALEESLHDAYGGVDNAGRTPVLEQGLDWQSVSMTPEDAEAIATAKFSLAEISRFFGVPLHKLGELDRATFSNIEEQNTDWVVDTVRPWCKRVEATVKKSLIPESQKRTHYVEFLLDDLLRGNTETRWKAYQTGVQTGVFSLNDVRKKENMNPIEGGDVHLIPLNFIPLDQAGEMPESQDFPPEEKSTRLYSKSIQLYSKSIQEERTKKHRLRLREAHRGSFRDGFGRIVRREVNDLRKAVKKHLGARSEFELRAYLEQFYKDFIAPVRDVMRPLVYTYARSIQEAVGGEWDEKMDVRVERYVEGLARHYTAYSKGQLTSILGKAENTEEELNTRLDEWDEKKADKLTRQEIVRCGEAVAVAAFVNQGYMRKRWVAVGKNCPLCDELNGSIIGHDEPFAQDGDTIDAAGVGSFNVKRTILTPPLHSGCDCQVVGE